MLLALITTGYGPVAWLGFPRFFGSAIAGLVLTVAFIVESVRFGRAAATDTRSRLIALAAAVLAVIAGLVWMSKLTYADYAYAYAVDEPIGAYAEPYGPGYEILPANIYAYLPDGTPLGDVLLFNEAGEPIDLMESGWSERLGGRLRSATSHRHLRSVGGPISIHASFERTPTTTFPKAASTNSYPWRRR